MEFQPQGPLVRGLQEVPEREGVAQPGQRKSRGKSAGEENQATRGNAQAGGRALVSARVAGGEEAAQEDESNSFMLP